MIWCTNYLNLSNVDPARIGLAPLQCECSVLPLNYGPSSPRSRSEAGRDADSPAVEQGIELGSHAPVRPAQHALFLESPVGVPRIELGSHAPEACIIPLYDTPTGRSNLACNCHYTTSRTRPILSDGIFFAIRGLPSSTRDDIKRSRRKALWRSPSPL